jgi:hypothetical protein
MPITQLVLQASGPLPLKGSFDFQGTDPATIIISGTAYGNAAGWIGVNFSIDGGGAISAAVWANEPASHKALVTRPAVIKPGFGMHQYSLDAAPNTMTDANDTFSVMIVY